MPRFNNEEKEALELIWRFAQTPNDIKVCKQVLGIKVATMATLRLKGAIAGAPPKLTPMGRLVLRGWRTCHDCHHETTTVVHDCPARMSPHPYRYAGC